MCGIFGLVNKDKNISQNKVKSITNSLFQLSESRGKDASGIAIVNSLEINILKRSISASKLIHSKEYNQLFSKNSIRALIGHSRMETNGSFLDSNNNQPVIKDGIVAIHNGIIVNDTDIWNKNTDLKRNFTVDTEIINSLIRKNLNKTKDLILSVQNVFDNIEGAASLGILFSDYNYLLLATNTGSLYTASSKKYKIIFFASEIYFLKTLIEKHFNNSVNSFKFEQIKPKTGCLINLSSILKQEFSLIKKNKKNSYQKSDRKINIDQDVAGKNRNTIDNIKNIGQIKKLINESYKKTKLIVSGLKRCTKCILPESMPFIEFDKKGVCNFCHSQIKIISLGHKELEKVVKKYRKKNGQPDCIVAFSGGRDSSYALHYVKEVLKMNPVAYSYDWGMLTDLGRRNQSRMTAALGIEHILISADIQKKRENIKKNVEAWLKKPSLGTIPLFMAGDKQYFYYANELMKQMNIKLMFLCECPLEKTDFKTGFCGVPPKTDKKGRFYSISFKNKLKMISFYLKEFIANPSYINSSLFDTFWAFLSYYFIPHNYVSFYNYIKWDEKTIDETLKKYNWELDPEIKTSWRIGDGTAAFYNYIYYTMSGLTENDTFKSNQIRSGAITRDKALKEAIENNKPRINSLMWYTNTIQISLKKAVNVLNKTKTVLFKK